MNKKAKKILVVPLLLLSMLAAGLSINNYLHHKKMPIAFVQDALVFPKYSSYDKEWKKTDSLLTIGLTKSAAEVVNAIYTKAKKDKNAPQLVKAIIHKLNFVNEMEEEAQVKMISDLKLEIDSAEFPVKPMLQSMLGELYERYYQNNRYRFMNRTEIIGSVDENLKTWDLKKISEEARKSYVASLLDENKTKRTPLGIYDSVLVRETNSKKYRPTLYDFLAHRALTFLANDEMDLTNEQEKMDLNNPDLFSAHQRFVSTNFSSPDSLSSTFLSLRLYQNLLLFHQGDKDPEAWIDIDLDRLFYMKSHSINENKDSLYENGLLQLESETNSDQASTWISHKLAEYYFQKNENKNFPEDQAPVSFKVKAYNKCEEAIHRFPDSKGASNCRYLQSQLLAKEISLETEKINLPQKPFRALLTWKNMNQVFVRIVKLDDAFFKHALRQSGSEEEMKKLLAMTPITEWSMKLPDKKDYLSHSSEIKMPALTIGNYAVLVSAEKNFPLSKNGIAVGITGISGLSYFHRRKENGDYELYITDRESGSALVNVAAQLFQEKYDYKSRTYENVKMGMYSSDSKGYINIPAENNGRNFYIELSKGIDRLIADDYFYQYKNNAVEKKSTHTYFFTDRAIYRPGQQVFFKGIILDSDGDKNTIKSNYSTTISLYDVNGKMASEIALKSNEYGTFSGSFTLPVGLLNGQMRIQNTYGSFYFSVEEYKRPSFEVKILPLSSDYSLGENITVKGNVMAYSGAVVDGAQLKYKVRRTARFPYWQWYWSYSQPVSPSLEIVNGSMKTSSDGSFEFRFKALPDYAISKSISPVFSFEIIVDVTDLNGETHSNNSNVSVAYSSLNVKLIVPEVLDLRTQHSFGISTSNMSNMPIAARGTIKIWKLKEPSRLLQERKWKRPDTFLINKDEYLANFPFNIYDNENDISSWTKSENMLTLSFETPKDSLLTISNETNWKSGKYCFEISSIDKFGAEVKSTSYITVFSPSETTTPINEVAFFQSMKDIAEPGDTASFIIGTRDTAVQVLYEVERKNNIASSEWIRMDAQQKRILLPIKENDRGNIAVHFIFIKRNRLYSFSKTILVPYSNKDLSFEYETFRNKLLPGEKEQWKIKISGKKGEKIAAEMLASMYDASLDAFAPHNWFLNINKSYYSSMNWSQGNSFRSVHSNLFSKEWQHYPVFYDRNYDVLNWFNGQRFYGGQRVYRSAMTMSAGRGEAMGFAANDVEEKSSFAKETPDLIEGDEAVGLDSSLIQTTATGASGATKNDKSKDFAGIKSRKNFSETAFFYPHLETNENGEILIAFTAPESLTRWKFQGFAHTKDLKFGITEREIVTQKELMITANAPRFLREGDKMVVTAKISNLSDHALSGGARLLLFDAITMNPLDFNFKIETLAKNFTAANGQSTSCSWTLSVPDGISAVTFRVIARAENFSDGEENTIPVLTNRMLVTESMPLPVKGIQTKSFHFDKLISQSGGSATLRNHKVTLEFTSNPAWYAVQSLPYLMEFPYECSEQIFSRFYANSLAAQIANSSPKIKAVFDSWKSTSQDALLSNLEKNQELKTILLEQTPWVMDAKNESERKKRVALLFDLNKMGNEMRAALGKLKKAQAGNGGWPWFEGMADDPYITQYILTGMGHLDKLGVKKIKEDKDIRSMVNNGVQYMDNRIREEYQELRESKVEMNKNHLSLNAIQYMYARSFFMSDVEISSINKEAYGYFKDQVQKYWNIQNRYEQGMIALALFRNGDKKTANAILKSLKENSLTSEEMGMYWKDNYQSYYWNQAPIESQALLIEAFDEIANDVKSVDDMKVWLLKSKQAQDWKTTTATASAVYALLLKGTAWLNTESSVEISIGKEKLNPSKMPELKSEAGTGYFKTSWSEKEITPEMGTISVTKRDSGVAWGAVYWQYFEQLDKITPHASPLHIEKSLFVERNTPTGPKLESLNSGTALHIGDKIKVRIILHADRTMEYVHMQDMRASAFEPTNVISGYRWQDGLGYYQSTRDASTDFFFSYLNKGTYVFEYALRAEHEGDFSNGITRIECMYAPEFTSHTEGVRVIVQK